MTEYNAEHQVSSYPKDLVHILLMFQFQSLLQRKSMILGLNHLTNSVSMSSQSSQNVIHVKSMLEVKEISTFGLKRALPSLSLFNPSNWHKMNKMQRKMKFSQHPTNIMVSNAPLDGSERPQVPSWTALSLFVTAHPLQMSLTLSTERQSNSQLPWMALPMGTTSPTWSSHSSVQEHTSHSGHSS